MGRELFAERLWEKMCLVGMAPLSFLSNVSNKSVYCDDLCLLKPNEKAGFAWFSVGIPHWPLGISSVSSPTSPREGPGWAESSIPLVTRLVLATSPHPEAIGPTNSHLTSVTQILRRGLTVIDRRHLSPPTTKKMT